MYSDPNGMNKGSKGLISVIGAPDGGRRVLLRPRLEFFMHALGSGAILVGRVSFHGIITHEVGLEEGDQDGLL